MAVTGPMLWLGTRGGHIAVINIARALALWNGREVVDDVSCLMGKKLCPAICICICVCTCICICICTCICICIIH